MSNFWTNLPKPVFCLAPMANVTDAAFRRIISKYAKPDIMFTEFVSVDGLCSRGAKNMVELMYNEKERPIVAQLFGSKPKNFEKAAKIIAKLGFDGIDINFGCPQKNIIKQGAGAHLIKNPDLAQEIIRATKKGSANLPISVKTRIGYNKNEIETWIPAILKEKPSAIIVHGRTKKEMSKVPAHWDVIARAVKIRDTIQHSKSAPTLIIGNGDVKSINDAYTKIKKYGVDGVMVGRMVLGNPLFFRQLIFRGVANNCIPTKNEKLNILIEHTKLFEKLLGKHKNFSIMKKHYKAYVSGWKSAKALRTQLMDARNSEHVKKIIQSYLFS